MLQSGRLKFAAKIDYVTVPIGRKPEPLPTFDGVAKLLKPRRRDEQWMVTLHDPTRDDIVRMVETFGDPLVMDVEIAVDLSPRDALPSEERAALIHETFKAVAGRFRPEDAALWGYGTRGAVNKAGGEVMSLERRQAEVGEQVIYGGRGEFMQAKLYLKTRDQNTDLPPEAHVVRMEVRLRRGACIDERIGLNKLSDLIGYSYRATFTKHFRIILEPALRDPSSLSPEEAKKRTEKMARAWATAGIAKFPDGKHPEDFPKETFAPAQSKIKKRRRTQASQGHYKLLRDQAANAKIGSALMNLQRRMSKPREKIRAEKTSPP